MIRANYCFNSYLLVFIMYYLLNLAQRPSGGKLSMRPHCMPLLTHQNLCSSKHWSPVQLTAKMVYPVSFRINQGVLALGLIPQTRP